MAGKITVTVSQGQSANPVRRKLEEDLVAALLFEPNVEVVVIPHLYDLTPDGTGMLCLQGVGGEMIVVSWLYPRAAHWILDRGAIKGHVGTTLLETDEEEDEQEEHETNEADDAAEEEPHAVGSQDVPNRKIYCLTLDAKTDAEIYLEEIRRIVTEASTKTVELLDWIGGNPQPEQMARYLNPTGIERPNDTPGANGNGRVPVADADRGTVESVKETTPSTSQPSTAQRIDEEASRRWYPVIDFSRCTNCMECIDFCLFGVYGTDSSELILVEQPDNCRKGCPACSRVCPENAILFPQHKSPAIAGAPGEVGGFKIDLSKLFGAPDGMTTAVEERDQELTAAGRNEVGMTVGIPKRQQGASTASKDDLDGLLDELDDLDL